MREIKFRCWDKKHKKFVEILDLHYNDGVYAVTVCENGSRDDNLFDEEFEIMQYTGLKDKNGKEIYEGDVVAIYGVDDEEVDRIENEIDICYYNHHEFPIIEVGRDVVTMDRFPRFWLQNEEFGYDGECLINVNDCFIIGNIYENPELLSE